MTSPRKPLRIAYIVHTFEMAGLERCIANLVNHLDRAHFNPMIVCLDRNSDAVAWLKRDNVRIVELRKRPGNDPRVFWRLAKALREYQVDVVHSHNWGTLMETALARRLARVPGHVHAEHGLAFGELDLSGWRRRVRGRFARWALRRADTVVAVAEGVRQRVAARFGYPAESMHVITNGVEAPLNGQQSLDRDRVRRALGIPAGAIVVGSVGRLVEVKDFGAAVDAVARLIGRDVDAHLLLVGDGPQRESLAARAEAAGVAPQLHLVGRQSDVGPYLAAMDVYVNCSLSEGMNLSILEAMAAGLPLAVTDVGENAALVGGEPCCGLVVAPGEGDQLAGALQELLEDRQARQRFGRRARERFERLYSTGRMVSEYETLYRTIVCRRQAPVATASHRKAES